MTAGVPRLPVRGMTGHSTMVNKDHERGEKRGVLDTGRAQKLEDADADVDDTEE